MAPRFAGVHLRTGNRAAYEKEDQNMNPINPDKNNSESSSQPVKTEQGHTGAAWYVERPRCVSVVAGRYTLRPHWKGLGDEQEIRDMMRLVAAAPALHEVAETLDSLDWIVGYELTESNMLILDRAIDKARAALSLVQPEKEKENQDAS